MLHGSVQDRTVDLRRPDVHVEAAEIESGPCRHDQRIDVKGFGHRSGPVLGIIHQFHVGSGSHFQSAIREVVGESTGIEANVVAHHFQKHRA